MKLQKLIIHNIASIEDATIDFEQKPLADSEVFLITGKTGSGKSTILDAICLALFANTPRLDNTKMQGKVDDKDDSIQISDTRQLMRRNTGEAFATLTFTGKNGIHYEAQWGITRAHKKPTGRLQLKTWTLKNLDTGNLLDKEREIVPEIKAAIGLDFQQFCRTTILAQGDFTRFLNSEDNEKAAILEKITGVDVYSKIGAKVFMVTGAKKKELDVSKGLVEGTKTLSPEEVKAKEEQLHTLGAAYNAQNEQRQKETAKLDWLKINAELTSKEQAATNELSDAKQITESDSFKQNETLTNEWQATIEARNWLSEGIKAKKEQEKQEEDLRRLSGQFATLTGGQRFAEQEVSDIAAAIGQIDAFLESEKEKAPIYEHTQTIVGQLKVIADGRAAIKMNADAIGKEQGSLRDSLQPALEMAKKAEQSAKDEIAQRATEIKDKEELVDKLQLPELRNQYNAAIQLLGHIATAQQSLDFLAREQKRRETVQDTLSAQLKTLEEKKLHSSEMEKPLNDAQLIMGAKKEALDNQKDTVDKFAQIMRSKLYPGDTCPVCRQKIQSELPHEEELAKLISGLEVLYKDAEKKFNDLNAKKINVDAEIKTAAAAFDRDKKAFDEDTSVAVATAKAQKACEVCGIVKIDHRTAQALAELKTKNEERRDLLDSRIQEGEAQEKELKTLRDAYELRRKALEKMAKATQAADDAVKAGNARIETAQTLISNKSSEVSEAEGQVQKWMASTVWAYDWRSCPKEFSDELIAATQTYNGKVQNRQQLGSDHRAAKDNLGHVSNSISNILLCMPDWNHIMPSKIDKVDGLLSKVNAVNTAVSTALSKLASAKTTQQDNRSLLNHFFEDHPGITLPRLVELDGYTAEQIAGFQTSQNTIRQKVASRQGALNTIKTQLSEHLQHKPELTEQDTLELLAERIADISNKLNVISEQKGAIDNELDTDKKNKSDLSVLIADADLKRRDYQKWERLNNLIGDATGNKFRKIAQSYVLENLIHSANHYMSTLTNRYTLKVQPGTFVILIEDAYQGFTTRAVSTISGGESFLVSLALALALSDIGQTLSVDTLFIDEGFGTLSGEPLQNAISTLHTLHSKSGRHVGIISHVEELQERIPVQIKVVQSGNNSSSKIQIVP